MTSCPKQLELNDNHTMHTPRKARASIRVKKCALANVGSNTVNKDANAIHAPTTRFPLYFAANHPDGIWVVMYP